MSTGLLGVAGVAAVAFASTNVDNLLVTSAQVAAARADRVRRIVYGQATGAAVVVAIAAVTAGVLFEVPARWIGLLGLVPLALGVRALVNLRQAEHRKAELKPPVKGAFMAAVAMTLGRGGDSLAVYIPVFRSGHVTDGAVTVLTFAVMEALLCFGALTAGRHPALLRAFNRAGVYLTPVLYLVVGVAVLVRAGTFHGL